jgi:hypothetical protein
MAIDPDLPFVLAGLVVVCGTAITLARIFYGPRKLEGARPAELQHIEERLTRIEQAVDAVALETERISEGQRFTTRLLAESPRVPAGVPTSKPPAS